MARQVIAACRIVAVWFALTWAGASQGAAIVGVGVNTNGVSFGPGQLISITLSAHNIGGPALTGDFFFGIIAPDGVTATFVVPGAFVTAGLDSDPRTWPPYQANVLIPSGFDVSIPNFFQVRVPAGLPLGTYKFFAALTKPRSLENGVQDADFLMLNTAGVTILEEAVFVKR